MNPSDWRKVATLVTQHKQEAAMAETDQLSSMPLSQIAIDESGPLVVHGSHMPVAASTIMGTIAHLHSSHQEDSYQDSSRYPQGSLYSTLSSLSLGFVASDTNAQSLSDKIQKVLTSIYKMLNSSMLQNLTILMMLLDLQIHHQCWEWRNR